MTTISLLCLTMDLFTILYLNDGWGHPISFTRTLVLYEEFEDTKGAIRIRILLQSLLCFAFSISRWRPLVIKYWFVVFPPFLSEQLYVTYRYFVFLQVALSPLLNQYDKQRSSKRESVYRRRTDNTTATRKSTKGQVTIYKTYI